MANFLFNFHEFTATAVTGWSITEGLATTTPSGSDVSVSVTRAVNVVMGFRTTGNANSIVGNSAWPDSATQTVTLNMAVTDVDIDARARVVRIDNATNTILQGGTFTGWQTMSASRTFSPAAPVWTNAEEDLTNDYGIEIEWDDTRTKGGGSTTVEVDTTSTGQATVQTDLPEEADLEQLHFRFRNDDGSEAAASWEAAEDVNITRDSSTDPDSRLRIVLLNNNGKEAVTVWYDMEYRKNAGSWTDLSASSSNVLIANIANLTQGDDTTQQLTDTYDFLINNNAVLDTINSPQPATELHLDESAATSNQGFETEISLQLVDGDLADTDTLEFRYSVQFGTDPITLTKIPKITISKGGGGATRRIFIIT